MERQARLLGKTYKQNLTILIDTEQAKMNHYFINNNNNKKISIFNEGISRGVSEARPK